MESSGTTPSGGIGPTDLPEAARLFDETGPFVSVYLHTPAAIENAAQQSELIWKNVRREMEEGGAPEAVLDEIEALVADAHKEGETLAVVATPDGVRLKDSFPEGPERDYWRIANLPCVGPLIEWSQQGLPHLIVLADRAGADIVAVVRGEEEANESAGTKNSSDPDLHLSQPGGWSQRRYQQRVKDAWDKNAQEVAERVAELYDEIGARLVIVAGDVHALEFLKSHLPGRIVENVQQVEGARSADGSKDTLASDITRAVATAVASETVALLSQFKQEQGQDDLAAAGVARTVEALMGAQVDTLLIADDPDDSRTVFFGPEPNMVGLDEATVKGMGVDAPMEGRLPDVLIRAAWGTGAAVRIVPSHAVRDGVGAILRFSTKPGS